MEEIELNTEDNLEAMRKIYQDIIKGDEPELPPPVGITGDPDCPYRDWRGTPLEVGATVLWGVGGSTGGVTICEGELLSINEKPDKKNCSNEWKFTLSVRPIRAAGKDAYWKMRGVQKKQGIVAVERVTVVF